MSDKTSYPLCWPENWPRTQSYQVRYSQFKNQGRYHSMDEARRSLADELERLGATNPVLSTNVKLRLDGAPRSDQPKPSDCGAAVYFTYKGKPVALACDKWDRVECNVWAIYKHIEALRGQQRWGVGSVEQAFRGYMAIPERTSGSAWWNVLGVPVNASHEQIRDAYRTKALECHPDRGGSNDAMARLNLAYEEAKRAGGLE